MTTTQIGTSPETGARKVASRDPATGEVWRSYAAATAEDVRRAVERARAAQLDWASRPLRQRVRVLEQFRRLLFARRQEVAETIARESGKPYVEALAAEVSVALDFARFYRRESQRLLQPHTQTSSQLGLWRKRIHITHEPYGVIGIIAPWNYPFMLPAGVVLPALAAGNAVVLKPSELTPTSAVLLGAMLRDAGVPDDAVAVLPGDGSAGAALVSAGIDKLFFTGSAATGKKVAIACAERLIPCTLELGGSDPAIVLEDADMETAAAGLTWGRFANAGQSCVAPKRVFVVGPAYERFVATLREKVEALRVGARATLTSSDIDIGALVHPRAADTLQGQLADALEHGARVIATTRPSSNAPPDVVAPTVLGNVTPDMRVMREETFGPLLPVVRVRDDDEAVALANASEFGLSASVWTRDTARALRLAARLQAGTVVLNDAVVVAGMVDVPHGGVKSSGTGRSHGRDGLLECVRTKTIVEDRFHNWRQPWWFGYSPEYARQFDAYVQVAHGHSLTAKLRAIPHVIGLVFRKG